MTQMSHSWMDWIFFGWFFAGSAGGWLLLGILAAEIWRKWRS